MERKKERQEDRKKKRERKRKMKEREEERVKERIREKDSPECLRIRKEKKLKGKMFAALKLVDKFTYLGSSILSTKTDINTQLAKAWTAINKSDLTDKMKCSFSQAAVVSILLYGCTTWILTKKKKSMTATTQECCKQYWTSPGGSNPQSSSCTATYHPSQKLSKLDKADVQDTTGEVGMNS